MLFRFHTEELDHAFWQYENSGILRDGNESIDSYTVGQDLPEYDDRYYREGSLERDMIQSSPQSQSKYRRRYSQIFFIHIKYIRRNNIDKTFFCEIFVDDFNVIHIQT